MNNKANVSAWEIMQILFILRSLGQVEKNMFLVRISVKKEAGGGRFFLLFIIISYCMISLHIITFPQRYVGALRSNINKTKRQILIKHKFV